MGRREYKINHTRGHSLGIGANTKTFWTQKIVEHLSNFLIRRKKT